MQLHVGQVHASRGPKVPRGLSANDFLVVKTGGWDVDQSTWCVCVCRATLRRCEQTVGKPGWERATRMIATLALSEQ